MRQEAPVDTQQACPEQNDTESSGCKPVSRVLDAVCVRSHCATRLRNNRARVPRSLSEARRRVHVFAIPCAPSPERSGGRDDPHRELLQLCLTREGFGPAKRTAFATATLRTEKPQQTLKWRKITDGGPTILVLDDAARHNVDHGDRVAGLVCPLPTTSRDHGVLPSALPPPRVLGSRWRRPPLTPSG